MCGAPSRKQRGMAAPRTVPVGGPKEVSLPSRLEFLPPRGGSGHTHLGSFSMGQGRFGEGDGKQ